MKALRFGDRGRALAALAWVALAASLAACSGGPSSDARDGALASTGEDTGTVGLALGLPGGDAIDDVAYVLADATGATVQSGSVHVAQSQSISFQLGGVPAGDGYRATLSATTTGGAQCSGAAGPFSVVARMTAAVPVDMACYAVGLDAGGVLVTGVPFDCAAITTLATADPSHPGSSGNETAVGGSLVLAAAASAPDPAALTFAWSASAPIGTFGSDQPGSGTDTVSFTCTAPGTTTITLVAGDGPVPDGGACNAALDTATTTITCDPLPLPGTQAVTYQIDPGHTGDQPADPLTPPLTQRWFVDFGEGSVSYPLIAGGRVFVTVAHTTTTGTDLFALDQATGTLLWGPTNLGGSFFWSAAAYDAGKVFAVTYDGLLTAFDAASGASLWSVSLPGQSAFTSAPTAVGGVVYLGGAGIGGTLYAVDEASGGVLWTQSVQGGDESSPAVSSSGVYVSYVCQQVYDFAPADGSLLWHFHALCEGGGGRTPALFGGRLYVRDVFAADTVFDAATGASLGTFSAGPIPAFDGAQGFFLVSGVLTARSLATSAVAWGFAGDGNLVTAPIVVNGNVYVGSSSGIVYAVDPVLGTRVWSANAGDAMAAPDEQNVSQPLTGLAAGGGALIVPASTRVVAFW